LRYLRLLRSLTLSSSAEVLVPVLTRPSLWDRFSSSASSLSSSLSRTPTPDQPPRSAWGSVALEEELGRCASLESSDCESLDSSNSGFGPEDDSTYLDGVFLPDFELLIDPEDEHLCANLMQLLQESLAQARLGSRHPARLLMPSQLVSQVGKELLRLAYSEPCGLRGALLDVCVEQGTLVHPHYGCPEPPSGRQYTCGSHGDYYCKAWGCETLTNGGWNPGGGTDKHIIP
ncbi:DNA damage-inducible transcript 4 protein-like, partial [Glossophaga mutica]